MNTWPTSRWLGEQLAMGLGGVAANLRFPFPGTHLRGIVDQILAEADAAEPAVHADASGPARREDGEANIPSGAIDPWRAERLVWSVLPLLPAVAAEDEGEPLRRWLRERDPTRQLRLDTWTLARAIADAFDDYALYRPDLLRAWEAGTREAAALPAGQRWQALLYRQLRRRLNREPFSLRVERTIALLREQPEDPGLQPLRLFGISSLAPVQVRLLQALSGRQPVDLYLLSPCPDLWQRCFERRSRLRGGQALSDPLDSDWLLRAPPWRPASAGSGPNSCSCSKGQVRCSSAKAGKRTCSWKRAPASAGTAPALGSALQGKAAQTIRRVPPGAPSAAVPAEGPAGPGRG